MDYQSVKLINGSVSYILVVAECKILVITFKEGTEYKKERIRSSVIFTVN